MRDRQPWMNRGCDPVLEILVEYDLALPPKTIHANLDQKTIDPPSYPTVQRAVKDLEEHGFIARLDEPNTHFYITEKGRRYLRGEPIEE